jgi:hypothetical protein
MPKPSSCPYIDGLCSSVYFCLFNTIKKWTGTITWGACNKKMVNSHQRSSINMWVGGEHSPSSLISQDQAERGREAEKHDPDETVDVVDCCTPTRRFSPAGGRAKALDLQVQAPPCSRSTSRCVIDQLLG